MGRYDDCSVCPGAVEERSVPELSQIGKHKQTPHNFLEAGSLQEVVG